MRASMRLAALMEIPSLFIFTHDSIGVGEDGPTHQPVEQLAAFRAMPNMFVFRPGDANEVTEAYKVAMQHTHGPSTLVFSRQAIPTFDRTKYAPASGVAKGGYVLADADGGKPEVILLGTGTELQHCVAAFEKLKAEGIKARVVSMPAGKFSISKTPPTRKAFCPPPSQRAFLSKWAPRSVGIATSVRRAK